MTSRTTAALAAILMGCGGTTSLVNPDASTASDSAVSGDVAATDVAPAADSPVSGDATNGDAPSLVDSGIADAVTWIADGATPEGGCDPITLVPDAAPGICAFTPADVACKTFSDCIPYVVQTSCSCTVAVIGVNSASTALCVPPPLPLPDAGCRPSSSYESQDCIVTTDLGQIFVKCQDGRCVSANALPGH
jgi:hypothetical protein